MRAEKVVSSLLNASSAIAGIVGTKIYAVIGSQAQDAPFVVYWKERGDREPTISMNGISIVRATVSVQCVTTDYPTLKDLGEAVRVALLGRFGDIAGVHVNEIQISGEGPDVFDVDVQLFAQLWQFSITHQE